MFGDKLVVRQILVESADDIVAIAVGVRQVHVELVPRGLGETHKIEPMPGPAFAVVRRIEQAVNDLLASARRIVSQEGIDLRGRRWQTDQIVSHTAEQRALVGLMRRREAVCFELGEDKPVHRVERPVSLAHLGRRCPLDRLKGPVLAAFLEIKLLGDCRRAASHDAFGPRRSHFDPGRQIGDLGVGQLALGRHAQIGVLIADRLDEQALVRLAGHKSRSPVAAFEHGGPAIQPQIRFRLLVPPG